MMEAGNENSGNVKLQRRLKVWRQQMSAAEQWQPETKGVDMESGGKGVAARIRQQGVVVNVMRWKVRRCQMRTTTKRIGGKMRGKGSEVTCVRRKVRRQEMRMTVKRIRVKIRGKGNAARYVRRQRRARQELWVPNR